MYKRKTQIIQALEEGNTIFYKMNLKDVYE